MKKEKGRNYYPIYDRHGRTNYFLDLDKIHIYSWSGEPVAVVEKGAVFNFQGTHLGWYDDGWLRDQEGKCVGFAEPGKGGPNPPRSRPPADPPAEKKDLPEKPVIEKIPERPARRAAWSELSPEDLFQPKKK